MASIDYWENPNRKNPGGKTVYSGTTPKNSTEEYKEEQSTNNNEEIKEYQNYTNTLKRIDENLRQVKEKITLSKEDLLDGGYNDETSKIPDKCDSIIEDIDELIRKVQNAKLDYEQKIKDFNAINGTNYNYY